MHNPILVVDDDDDIRETLQEALQMFGYSVRGAANGQEALNLLGQMEEPPCLILLDLMMPVMSGQQFRAKQLENAEFSKVPVIIVSADGNATQKAAALGVAYGIPKPIDFDVLYEVTQKFCAADQKV